MQITGSLNPWLRQCFTRLVAERTGLEVREDEELAFNTKIFARTKALKLPFPEAYYQLLESQTVESDQEWQHLAVLLTNPESFFFRDKRQLDLLKKHIIPELIQRKQQSKTIRVCSAGCSTGEEPYSLAILLKELIPNLEEWNLTILGVDINPVSVEKAKAGIYRAWSFRGVDASIQQQYFKPERDRYQIQPQIRQMLDFEVLNLVKDPFPHPHSRLREMDLILCRNVFIYFGKSAIAAVLNKVYQALQPAGCLLTGHAELHAQDVSQFQTRVFSEAIVYQRPDHPLSHLPLPALIKTSTPAKDSEKTTEIQSFSAGAIEPFQSSRLTEHELIQRAENLLRQKAYHLAVQQTEKALELNPGNAFIHHLMARILSELDDWEKAIDHCQQAIEIDHSALSSYYLLAGLFERQGKIRQAEQILKQVIQLDSGSIAAYVKLSQIYQQEGDRRQTVRMQELAFAALKPLAANRRIPELNHITVAELTANLESTLKSKR